MQLLIGDNVKRLRRERGLTQEELAEAIGIAGQTVSKWERGDGYPDITTLPLIANHFKVSVDEVLGMEHIRDEARIDEARRSMEALSAAAENALDDDEKLDELIARRSALRRELAYEFPDNYSVQFEYAGDLRGNAGDPEAALPIIKKILANCTDGFIRAATEEMLAEVYLQLGERELWAKQVAGLPTIYQTREWAEYAMLDEESTDIQDVFKLRMSATQLANLAFAMCYSIEKIQARLGIDNTAAETLRKQAEATHYRILRLWETESFGGQYGLGLDIEALEADIARLEAE